MTNKKQPINAANANTAAESVPGAIPGQISPAVIRISATSMIISSKKDFGKCPVFLDLELSILIQFH